MSVIAAGFGDTIHDSQYCFRQLLTAMSQPGTLVELNLAQGFGSMMPASTQILLALADNSTPVWLSNAFANDIAIRENLNFHLGCAILSSQKDAESLSGIQQKPNFAVISQHDIANFDWSQTSFYVGCEEYPDRSTTVIVEVVGLSTVPCSLSESDTESPVVLRLSGPGIEREARVVVQSLSSTAISVMLSQRKTHKFPLGLDFILVSGEQVVALPRSTTVEVMPCM
ncbi:phosphonate C-P lyase system protein PhnH [Vibrio algivorus]|uniref:Carbon-phosphorus lyase subunit PhnH n=1 Tax=Vibrio algivorus TaxID=1667024 RepID=A0ABQ6EP20_9VIBR|nr:phosphonate C-P lyase system protein PhnH [Vibrio algivorus]GLT14585.1 carbon-phosphorus lyase subunit PhnH [Vibrio algivorus]